MFRNQNTSLYVTVKTHSCDWVCVHTNICTPTISEILTPRQVTVGSKKIWNVRATQHRGDLYNVTSLLRLNCPNSDSQISVLKKVRVPDNSYTLHKIISTYCSNIQSAHTVAVHGLLQRYNELKQNGMAVNSLENFYCTLHSWLPTGLFICIFAFLAQNSTYVVLHYVGPPTISLLSPALTYFF
jgi:hypothetical protein